MDAEIRNLWDNCEYLKDKNRILEDRSRRNNLRVDGLYENEGENWQQTEEKVKKLFKEKLCIERNIEIERAHRTNGKENNATRPTTIIMKLLSYKDKEIILANSKKLNGTGIYINEDFSEETRKIRRSLREQMKEERKRGKYCVIKYDKLFTREFKKKNNGHPTN